jgi:hypothetical protein
LFFFCLQPEINIPEFLTASKITDLINASNSELVFDGDEPGSIDLSYLESEMLLNAYNRTVEIGHI